MTGLSLCPCPPHLNTDMLGAIVSSLALTAGRVDRPRARARLRARRRRRAVLDLVPAAADRRWRDGPAGAARPRRVAMGSVRMGEIAVSRRSGDELVALGLGSCIGLALVDRSAGVAGLAHVVLPESSPTDRQPGKFADLAVPELIDRIVRAGASRRRLEAVLAGGARMFELGDLDIGARNAEAVRSGLAASGLRSAPPRPAATAAARCGSGRRCRSRSRRRAATSITLLDGSAGAARRAGRRRRDGRDGHADAQEAAMSEMLDPDKIAALVEAAKQGQLPEQAERPPTGAASGCGRSTSRARRSSPATSSAGSPARSRPSARRR